MPSLTTFKTTNSAYWLYKLGVPCWVLDTTSNAWDPFIDAVAAAISTFTPYSPANITAPITVTSSPFTYTNTDGMPEMVYIQNGAVASVTKNGVNIGLAMPLGILLAPGKSIIVSYPSGGAPSMFKDY